MATSRTGASEARCTGQRPRRRAATLIAYFDTSALIKTLFEEEGSQLADELWARSSTRIASRLVYAEAHAALAAAARGGRIDKRMQRTTVNDLQSACAAMLLIGVDWSMALHAGTIAEEHALRGYDAVHLATALAVDASDLVLVTWDRDLARAATHAGIAVSPSLRSSGGASRLATPARGKQQRDEM